MSNGMEMRVPYPPRGTTYTDRELEVLRSMLLHSTETLSCGIQRTAFEQEFAAYVGVDPERAVATSSCTVSLELATYLAGLRPGDNVVVTPQSYQATLNPLLCQDVEVRFGDVDSNTLCLDPASVAKNVDDRTRAVFLTHYGGLMVDLVALHDALASFDVIVVEDCAHAHGGSLHGRRAGSWGNVSCYSFQSMKNMSTLGQGGMMILPTVEMAQRLRGLISVEPDATFVPRERRELGPHQATPAGVFTHDKNAFTHDCETLRRHGTNSTLPEPSAAVGRVQLQRLDEMIEARRRVAARLDERLATIPSVRVQETPPGQVHAHHLYTCFVDCCNARVAAGLVAAGIEIQQRYFPLHLLPEWRHRGGRVGLCPVTEDIWFEHQLNLPIHPAMPESQVDYVADSLRRVCERI